MKVIRPCFLFAFAIIVLTNSCKKKSNEPICGCNADDIKYYLTNISGSLSYYQYNGKWVFSYQPIQGNISNYFPCNTTNDSLQTILRGANEDQVFQVEFSGKIKGPCESENFGFTNGVTTFDYIIIDSLKRN